MQDDGRSESISHFSADTADNSIHCDGSHSNGARVTENHRQQQHNHHHEQQQQQAELRASVNSDITSHGLNVDSSDCVVTSALSPSVLEPVEQTDSDVGTNYQSPSVDDDVTAARPSRPNLIQLGAVHIAHPSSAVNAAPPTVGRSCSTPTFLTPVESPSLLCAGFDNIWNGDSDTAQSDVAFSTPTYAKMRHFTQSPVSVADTMTRHAQCPDDGYMSPLSASDDLLRQMCPIYFVVSPPFSAAQLPVSAVWKKFKALI